MNASIKYEPINILNAYVFYKESSKECYQLNLGWSYCPDKLIEEIGEHNFDRLSSDELQSKANNFMEDCDKIKREQFKIKNIDMSQEIKITRGDLFPTSSTNTDLMNC